MLQGRLTVLPAALTAVLLLGACSGETAEEFRPIEQLERTGATAIDQAGALACNADASTLRTALDVYETLKGEPAPDEAALVTEGYLRAESELWDIREGQLVPQDPGCGDVPTDVPTEEIVTEPVEDEATIDEFADELATMTPDDVLADAGADEIAEVGGRDCAYEVAEVGLAFARWSIDNEAEPSSLLQLVGDGYLQPLDLWTIGDRQLDPSDDSSCLGPFEMLASPDRSCRVEARTLDTARDAYLALFPDATDPTQQDLIDAELIRDITDRVDLVDGEVVAVAGGVCDGVDLSESAAPIPGDGPEGCEVDYRTIGVAIESFVVDNGVVPDNEQQLIDAGKLAAPSERFDVVYGAIVPGDGSICTVPPD